MQQWGLRVANDFVLNQFRVYHERVYVDNVVIKFWFVRSSFSQHHSKFIANIATEIILQFLTKTCKARSFICKVNLNFLRSSRHFNCDTAFAVIVSFSNESVHGFNNFRTGRVKTGLQIVNFRRFLNIFVQKLKFFLCDILVHWWVKYFQNCNLLATFHIQRLCKKFVKELSVLCAISCADALKTNSFVNDFNPKLFWSTVLDKIYHGYSRPVDSFLCMLEVFWKNLQKFPKLPV